MPTNAEMAAQLLRHAAQFFRRIGGEHSELQQSLNNSALTYDRVAELVEQDPVGQTPEGPTEG